MDYGPFSLEDATAAELKFKLWLYTELNYDFFGVYTSTNGYSWSFVTGWTGNSAGWIDRVVNLSSALGQPNIWVSLYFYSDSSINYAEGAYVDNIVLRKCPVGATCPAGGALSLPEGGQLRETRSQISRPR